MKRTAGFREVLTNMGGLWREEPAGDMTVFYGFVQPFEETRPVPAGDGRGVPGRRRGRGSVSQMSGDRILTESVLAKIREQVEQAQQLVARLPIGRDAWGPEVASGAFSVDRLLGHLLECLAGFCAVLLAAKPAALPHFADLRARHTDGPCPSYEAAARMREILRHIEEGFAHMTDADLARRLPTVFVPEGESVLTLLLGNLEHLVNHKYQLFFYLKLLGVPVGTPDLYRLRGTD
jgi:uncharacterized damage-inducible protein DinB